MKNQTFTPGPTPNTVRSTDGKILTVPDGSPATLDRLLRAVPAVSPQAGTRVFTVETTTGADFSQGPTTATGRTLDVAIQGQGWLTVQAGDGSEAYTRNGSLQLGPDGTLQLPNGLQVQGTGGPISIPAVVPQGLPSGSLAQWRWGGPKGSGRPV